MIWICRPCNAYVGVHKNNQEYIPLGRLANAELRSWKEKAHSAFDPMWKAKIRRDGCSKSKARKAGYKWLADQLGIKASDCHIGEFDIDSCKKVIKACIIKK